MKSSGHLSIVGIVAALVIGLFSATSVGASHTHNNIYIHQKSTALGSQVFILQDYTGNINAQSLILEGSKPPAQITLRNPCNCYGTVNTAIWYFYLAPGQTAQLTDYVSTPVHLALWVPVDSSICGQNPNTCWFSNTCFSTATYQSPSTANPAGATFVELNVGAPNTGPFTGPPYDTADISEVNGVNAQWRVSLPGGWTNKAYRSAQGSFIPVYHIQNNPGPGSSSPSSIPNFYGDYGNPGVYPFGCTNCASRYNNPSAPGTPPGTQRSGCLASESQPPVTYPTFDVGCDNAINYYPNNALNSTANAPLATYETPPPGVSSLPFDSYYHSPHGNDTLHAVNPNSFVGYGICNILRGALPAGGDILVELEAYPFGQIQPPLPPSFTCYSCP